jgi:TolA-binding protein
MACVVAVAIALGALARPCPAAANADPALDRYYNGNALCKRGLYPLAVKEYEAFLAANPAHEKVPNAQWGLALCHYGMGTMDKAAALFERLAGNARVTDQDQLHNLWGSSLVVLGKQAEAIKAFEWTLKNSKEQARKADALAGLTQAHSLLEDWPAVVRTSEDLIQLAPDSPYADLVRYQGAVARMNLKQYAEAAEAFERLAASSTDAELVHQSVYQKAECLVKLDKPAEAIKQYELAATGKPGKSSEAAHFNLGLLQFRTGDYTRAIATLKGFAQKYPESARADEASLLLGRAYLEAQNYREAAAVFEGLLGGVKSEEPTPTKKKAKQPPVKPSVTGDSSVRGQVLLWLARTHARQGQYQAVQELLAPVVADYRQNAVSAELYYELATAQMQIGQYAAAAGNFAESEKGQDPLPAESLRLRAFCLYRSGDGRTSLPLCDAFLAKYPDSPHKAEVLFIKGENLMALGRLLEAIPAFQAVLAAGPEEARAKLSHLRIAQAYYHQKMWAECVASLAPILKEDPPVEPHAAALKPRKGGEKKPATPDDTLYHQVWFMAGECYFCLQQWPKAVEALNAFLARHPDQPNADKARYNLALAYQKVAKPAEAIAALQPFLRMSKNQDAEAEALRVRAMLDLGRLQYETGDYRSAGTTLNRIAENPDAVYYLGWIAMKQNDPATALRHFGAVAKLRDHPFATDAALQQSVLEYRAGNYAEAEKTLTTLAATFPRNAMTADCIDTIFYLGLCRARQKKYDDAIKDFTEVIRRAGESPRAPEALYWQAWCETQRGNPRQAESLYTAFLSKYPADRLLPAATLDLAELRFHRQPQNPEPGKAKAGPRAAEADYASIAEALRPLLAEDSKTPATGELRSRALYLLGWCLFRQGEMGPAAKTFETLVAAEEAAAKTDPAYRTGPLVASACFQAGEARRNLKEFGPAKELFEKAARLRGAVATADQDDMLLRLAQLEAINGQWRESLQTAQTLLKSFPESQLRYEALFAIGWAYENQKQYGPALEHYRKVTAANARDDLSARAQFQIGECCFAQGQYDGAIAEFNLVLTKYASDQWKSLALLAMGRSLKAQGKTMQARAYFDDVVLKYPNTTAAELAEKLLGSMQE